MQPDLIKIAMPATTATTKVGGRKKGAGGKVNFDMAGEDPSGGGTGAA